MSASDTESQTSTLIRTKLHRPHLPRDLVPRPRLRARLNHCLEHRLILVSAPAGFGKTTLLAECAADSPHPVAWLSLDRGDNDLGSFLRYLVAAIQTAYPNTCSAVLHSLQTPQAAAPDHLARMLISDISELPEDLVLVLDDYQAIKDEAVHQLLATLVRNLPPQLHLVLGTRKDPPLSLAGLRVSEQMVELRMDDLRFTLDEAQAFLELATGEPLDKEAVAVLHERTEGWIAGLRMAALSLRGAADPNAFVASFRGSSRLVVDYLMEEVLSRQPAFVQSFLLRTSIMERFCAPLCDAVLDGSQATEGEGAPAFVLHPWSSSRILEDLEQAGLFLVPLDDERAWYRYHHLVQEALDSRRHVECSQGEIAELHARAGAWLAEQGTVDEALQHTAAAGDVMAAVRLIERYLQDLLNHESWPTLDRWLRMLPQDIVQEHPALLLAEAWLMHRQFKFDAVQSLVDQAEALLDSDAVAGETPERILRGRIDAFRCEHYYWQGEAKLCLKSAYRALDYLPARCKDSRTIAIGYGGQAHQMLGQLEEAERFFSDILNHEARDDAYLKARVLLAMCGIYLRSANLVRLDQVGRYFLEFSEENRLLEAACWAHHWLGPAKYEWSDLDTAERHFLHVVQARPMAHLAAVHNSMLWLSLVYQAQGRLAAADQVVEDCHNLALKSNNILYHVEADAFRARLSLMRGDVESAVRWLKRAIDPGLPSAPSISVGTPALTRARVLIAQGTPDSLQTGGELLREALDQARAQYNTRRVIKILALQALAFQAGAQEEQALAALEEAIALAWPSNFIRTFVDMGPAMRDLLSRLAGRGVAPDYLHRVLDAFPEPLKDDLPAAIERRTTKPSVSSPATSGPSPALRPSPPPPMGSAGGSNPPRVLIIEDDEEFADLLGEMLDKRGHELLFARDGVEGVQIVQTDNPDLVVLDVLMPRMDGWETCRSVREISDVPIIILSCLTDEADKVRGLGLGADDYLTKPVSKREFVARVQAALRRSSHPIVAEGIVPVDDRLAIDREHCELLVDGRVVDLSATEFKLLTCLLDNANRISTHQSLLTQVWGWEYAGETGYVKVYIHHLRKKIEVDPQNPRYILTERGLGYRFQFPTRR